MIYQSNENVPRCRSYDIAGHYVVELRGFEPLTSSVPRKRATNCAIAPYQVFVPPCWATSSSIHSFISKTNSQWRYARVILNTGLRQGK